MTSDKSSDLSASVSTSVEWEASSTCLYQSRLCWIYQLRQKVRELRAHVTKKGRSQSGSGTAGSRDPEDASLTWSLCPLPLLSSVSAHFQAGPSIEAWLAPGSFRPMWVGVLKSQEGNRISFINEKSVSFKIQRGLWLAHLGHMPIRAASLGGRGSCPLIGQVCSHDPLGLGGVGQPYSDHREGLVPLGEVRAGAHSSLSWGPWEGAGRQSPGPVPGKGQRGMSPRDPSLQLVFGR